MSRPQRLRRINRAAQAAPWKRHCEGKGNSPAGVPKAKHCVLSVRPSWDVFLCAGLCEGESQVVRKGTSWLQVYALNVFTYLLPDFLPSALYHQGSGHRSLGLR